MRADQVSKGKGLPDPSAALRCELVAGDKRLDKYLIFAPLDGSVRVEVTV